MKTKKTTPNRLATLAAVTVAVLLMALTPQSAFGWDTVARDTGYQSAQNPSLFLGDHFDLGWDIGAGYNQAQYGLGTVNAAASLSWNTVTYQTGGGACSGEKYKNTIQVTSVGTWYYSLWVGYTAGQGGLGGGNGQYYNGSSTCNTGGSNGAGNGAFTSDAITVAALNTPTSQSANSASSSSINLTWAQGVSGGSAKNTVIFRSTNNTAPTLTQGTAYTSNQTISSGSTNYTCVYATASGTSATDTGLTAGTIYYYYFFAENYSYYSAAVSASAIPRPTTVTWNGSGSDNNLQTDANWVGGVAPVSGISTFLTFAGSTRPTPYNNFPAGSTFSNVFFNGITVPFTLGGSNFNVQQKIENDNSSLVTITNSITWAASSGPTSGEINAVGGNLDFTNGTLTVNGSSIAGIKMWNAVGETNIFDGTVSASGKWFGLTQNPAGAATINGSFTSGDFYLMNGGTLNLASSGSFSTSGLRLGGDYGNTGNQDLTKGGTFNLTSPTGGQTYSGIINSVAGNTSGKLVIYSANTSGTNIINGASYLDSGLIVSNAAGGTLLANASTAFDVKAQQLTLTPYGTILIQGILTSSTSSSSVAGGTLLMNGPGTLLLSNTANAYSGTSGADLNANSTLITGGGVLGIYGDGSLGVVPNGAYNNIQFTGSGTLQDTVNNVSLNVNRSISVAAASTATLDSSTNIFAVPGIISGSGAVAKAGFGTLTLSGGNNFSGGLTANGGTVSFASDGTSGGQPLGAYPGSVSAANVTLNGGGLLDTTTTTIAVNRGITLGGSGGTLDAAASQTLSVSSVITGSGALTKGTNTGTLALSANNSFSGGLIVNGGTVSFASDGNSGNRPLGAYPGSVTAANVTLNGGGLLDTTTATISANRGITLGASGGMLDVAASQTLSVSSVITGSGALTKGTNTGTLTLSGANTFGGGLTIKAGAVKGTTSTSAFGSDASGNPGLGTIYLGDTSGSTGAGIYGDGRTFTNPIVVVAGTSGTLSVSNNGGSSTVFSGNVTMNNALNLASYSTGSLSLSGNIGGSKPLIVTSDGGANYVAYSGNNGSFTGTNFVQSGTNRLSSATALNSANVVQVSAGACLNIYGASAGMIVTNSGLIDNAGAGGVVTANNNNSTLAIGGANAYSFNGVLADGSKILSLSVVGTGAQTLSGNNSYSGGTTITAGELIGVTGGSVSNSAVTIASGGTNGVQVAAANGAWYASALTAQSGSYIDLNVNGQGLSTTVAPLQVLGNLAITNPTIIVRNAGSPGPGRYPLIKYAGTFAGSLAGATFSLPTPSSGSATVVTNLANKSIDLVVANTNLTPLTWNAGGGYWDNALQNANWKNGATTGLYFTDGKDVIFDDTGTGTSILVTNLTPVSPSSVTNNATKNYTIYGNAIAGGGAFTKLNTGALTLAGANTYTGGTLLAAGTLELDATNALGTGLLTVTGGALTNNANAALTNVVNLSVNTTVGVGGGQTLLLAGGITNAGALTKTGTGTLTLSNTNTFAGGLNILNGTLASSGGSSGNLSATAFGTGTITLGDSSGASSATLNITNAAGSFNLITNPIVVAAGSSGTLSILGNNNYTTNTGAVALNNNLTVSSGNSGKNMVFSGLITEGGSNPLIITEVNGSGVTSQAAFSGGVSINSGGLTLSHNAATGALTIGPGNITGNGPLTFNANSSGAFSVSGGINSTGNITNSGTGSGTTTISGIISNGVANVVQNSPTSPLTLSGANTNGALTVLAGTVNLSTSASAGGMGTIALNATSGKAATVLITTAINIANPIVVPASSNGTNTIGGNNGANVFNGPIFLTNNLSLLYSGISWLRLGGPISGSGNLTSDATSSGFVLMAGTNTAFTGNVTVHSGQLSLGTGTYNGANSLNASNTVTLNTNSILDVEYNVTLAGLQDFLGSTGTGVVTNQHASTTNTLTLGGSGSYTFSGSIADTNTRVLNLAKVGGGTQILAGTNTYSGTTTVTNGTLLVNGYNLGTNSVTVTNAGAILGGTGVISGPVTFSSGTLAQFTLGAPMAISNSLTLSGSPQVQVSMSNNVPPGAYVLATFTGSTGLFNSVPVILAGGSFAPGMAGSLVTTSTNVLLNVAVSSIPSTNTITSSNPSLVYGGSVTFTATVQTNSPTGAASGANSNFIFSVDGVSVATNLVNGSSQAACTISTLTAGSHAIRAVYVGDAAYSPSTNTYVQTVSQLPVMITGTRAYDGTALATNTILKITNSVGADNVTNFLQATAGYATLAGSGVGSQSIIATNHLTLNGGVGTNYTLVGASGSVVITAAPLTITASGTNKVYGQTLALTGFTTTGLAGGETVGSVTLTASGSPAGNTAGATVGNYVITPSAATGGTFVPGNYVISYVAGILTVTPLVAVLSGTRAYDGTTNAPGANLTVTNVANSDTVTLGGTGGLASAYVGTNAITSLGSLSLDSGAGTNYTLAGATGLMIITNTPLVITANNAFKTYDGTGYIGGNGVTYAGFVNGETNTALIGSLSYGGLAQGATNAGTYNITPGGYSSTNYLISYVDGTLTINPLAVTVTADSQTKVYGSADPALTYTNSPALVAGDSFTGALGRVAGEAVGSYAINQGGLALSANYSLTFVGTNLTITAAPLVVTANSTNKVYGQTLVFAGTEFTTSGLQFSDSVTSVILNSAGATNTATVGSYDIVPGSAAGSGLANYTIGYSNGTLTVTQATPTNTLAASANPAGFHDTITFTNTLNADATGYVFFRTNSVLWSSNNLSGGVAVSLSITNLPRGTNLITAAYSGDTNYVAASITLNQVVTNHPPVANPATYSRGAFTTWQIVVSNLLTNAIDADGDTLTLVGVSASTNGITVVFNTNAPARVSYYNTNLVADQFTYTVADGFGGTNSAVVTLTATGGGVTGTSSITSITGTSVKVLTAYGITGYTYVTQRATNVNQVTWLDLATNTLVSPAVIISVTDSNPPSPSAFYRLLWSGH